MEFFPVFDAGHIEKTLAHMDDGIRGGKGSGSGRRNFHHSGSHLLQQGRQGSFLSHAGIDDFLLRRLEAERFEIRRKLGDEWHIGRFRDRDIRQLRPTGKLAGRLDGSPAAIHEKNDLPLMKIRRDFLGHLFMVIGTGENHEDIPIVHGLLQIRQERDVKRSVQYAVHLDGFLIPYLRFGCISHIHFGRHIFQFEIRGRGNSSAAGPDDRNIHGNLRFLYFIDYYYYYSVNDGETLQNGGMGNREWVIGNR